MRLEQWALVGHQEIFGSREIAQAITAAVRNRTRGELASLCEVPGGHLEFLYHRSIW